MNKDIFVPIFGYEGLYEINNKGDIFSLPKERKCGKCSIILKRGRFLNISPNKDGYLRAYLTDINFKEKSFFVHRLVALHFIPNPTNRPFVNHLNGIKNDNRIENLEWCTCKENILHAFRTGLKAGVRGEKNNLCKLTKKEVLEIRTLFPKIKSYKKLSIMYSTSIGNIYHIIKRSTWNHI